MDFSVKTLLYNKKTTTLIYLYFKRLDQVFKMIYIQSDVYKN